MLIIHKYKNYNIVKNGTKEYPWNIYRDDGHGFGDWIAYGRTLKDCKFDIDNSLEKNLLEEELLMEMADVVGKYVKVENINFSFYFSQKQGQHTIRAKICWNRERLSQFDGIMQLFGNYIYKSTKNPINKPSSKDINQARKFFKKYKVLFAACWEDKLQAADIVHYFEGQISFKNLIKEFYAIDNYDKIQEAKDIFDLYKIVKKYNIFNLYDGELNE